MLPRKSLYGAPKPTTSSVSTTPGKTNANVAKAQVQAPLMTVAVRVRPLSAKEMAQGHRPVVMAESESIASIEKLERSGAVLQSERGQMHAYEFDRVFGETSSNLDVYENTAKNLVPKVLEGMNCTIFAYGATGAGKTHSIMGNESDPGMMPLSMMDLFEAISRSHDPLSFNVKVSYMEVYCETIRDLLTESEKPLNPCEVPTDGTVCILGLTERDVRDVDEVLQLVREGNSRRKTEPTAANEFSSRSHAVLQVTVRKLMPPNLNSSSHATKSMMMTTGRRNSTRVAVNAAPECVIRQARLSLIDLAGSERAANTLNTGARLREGANINKSLLALANCINALSTGDRVKYRDSKLTHLLKSSLEGDCFVAMLAAVNPSHKSYEESHNTLKYANRAKSIKANVAMPAAVPTPSKATNAYRPSLQPMPSTPPEVLPVAPSSRPLLMAVDENVPSGRKPSVMFSVFSPSSAKKEKLSVEQPKLEQAYLAIKRERDVIAQERDALHAELLKAKDQIENLKRASMSFEKLSSHVKSSANVAAAPAVPPKMRPSSAHIFRPQPPQATVYRTSTKV